MTYADIKKILGDSIKLGIKSVVLIGGGEPLLYPRILDLISYIHSKEIVPVVFTNGSLLGDEKLARKVFNLSCDSLTNFLFKNNVSIILKADTFNNPAYDKIVGRKNSGKIFKKSLDNILAAYQKNHSRPCRHLRAGLATVLMRNNKNEIDSIWKYARNNNLFPHFEPVGYEGRAKKIFNNIGLVKREVIAIYKRLSEIDKHEYNILWDYNIALPAYNCQQLRYSVYINSDGRVQPCNGISLNCSNIRKVCLEDILKHPSIAKVRDIYDNINDKCKNCVKYRLCYGCQGRSYNLGDGLFTKDPFCSKK